VGVVLGGWGGEGEGIHVAGFRCHHGTNVKYAGVSVKSLIYIKKDLLYG